MDNENNVLEPASAGEATEKTETAEKTEKTKKKKGKVLKRVLLTVLVVILSLAAILVGGYFILRAIGKSHFHPAVMKIDEIKTVDNVVAYDEGKTLKYNGKTYKYNEDVIFIAFMGVDKNELDSEEGVAHSAGQSDTNMLIAVDTESGKMSLVIIPRDSMAEVNIYNAEGKQVGITKLQLCLAYSYGDGRETSCENVLKSMERLLYGIEINNYYSLDLKGIGALNDAVGGVEVVCLETLKNFCYEGEVKTLRGRQAQIYVQRRDTTTFNSDALRRQRQIQYAKAFAAKAFAAIKEDYTMAADLYSIASDYACTNFDITRFTYLVSVIIDKYDSFSISEDDIYVLPGEAKMGQTYMEVELDRDAVFETILKVFYKEVKE